MTERERFREMLHRLWRTGVYPTPTILNAYLHRRKSNNLNGRESKWRTESMKELGIPLRRPKGSLAARRQMAGLPRGKK